MLLLGCTTAVVIAPHLGVANEKSPDNVIVRSVSVMDVRSNHNEQLDPSRFGYDFDPSIVRSYSEPIIEPTPTPEPPKPIIRNSCGEIAGTPYESIEEREWFRNNCVKHSVAILNSGEVQSAFIAGYIAGGGNINLLPIVLCIIEKESGWDTLAVNDDTPGSYYYGLGQFLMSTWRNVGGGDWTDPYTQGVNFAKNWNRSGPEGQWPAAYLLCLR